MEFLARELDDRYEVYFQPTMDGDKPDVVILRQRWGVAIVAVKDWDPGSYDFTKEGVCRIKSDGALLPSPIKKVHQYKKHLIDLYLPDLCAQTAVDARLFAVVSTAVYFHRARGSGSRNVLTPWPKPSFFQMPKGAAQAGAGPRTAEADLSSDPAHDCDVGAKEGNGEGRSGTSPALPGGHNDRRRHAGDSGDRRSDREPINAELRKLEEIQAGLKMFLQFAIKCYQTGKSDVGKCLKRWWTWPGSNRRPLPCHGMEKISTC